MPECHVFANFAVHSEVAVLFGNLKYILCMSHLCLITQTAEYRHYPVKCVETKHSWLIPLFRDEGGRYVTLVAVDLTKTIVYRLGHSLASEACMFLLIIILIVGI